MTLVLGTGMRYDATAFSAIFSRFSADFGHFQPFSAASATHDPLAKP
jgi:hypothetical protein